jgi:hypothetical protein
LPHHAQERLLDERGITSVFEGGRELFGKPDGLVELSNGQEPSVTGEGLSGNLDLDGPGRQEFEGKERRRV